MLHARTSSDMFQGVNGTDFDTTHPIFTTAEDITTKFLYIMIAIINFAANSTLIYIILKHKRIQNTVNLLLLNLSFADIVMGIAVFPYLFIEIRSDLSCGMKDGMPLFHAASMTNFLTLAFLSLSRYLLINHATRPQRRIRKPTVKWLVLISWLVGIVVMTPNLVYSKYNKEKKICENHWVTGNVPRTTFICSLIISTLALAAMLFTYFSTVHTLWFKRSTQRLQRSNSISTIQTCRKRITVLLGMLMAAFLICWLPFTTYLIFSAGEQSFPDTADAYAKKTRLKRFTVLAAFLNTCMDPLFYVFGNSQIKEEAGKTFSRAKYSNGDATVIEQQ